MNPITERHRTTPHLGAMVEPPCARSSAAHAVNGRTASGPAATVRWQQAGAASASASSPRWSPSWWWSARVILWRFFGDALSNRSRAPRPLGAWTARSTVAVVADPRSPIRSGTSPSSYNQTAEPVGDRCVQGRASSPPTPTRWSTASSASGPPNSVSAPRCGSRRARCPRPGWKRRPARRPSATADRWSPPPSCLPSGPQLKDASGPTELGHAAGPADQPDRAGRAESAGLGAAAAVVAAQWRQRRFLSGGRGGGRRVGTRRCAGQRRAGAVNTLMGGQPKLADNKASTAMDALLDAADPATAPVHAVVTTEQQLFERGASLPDAEGHGRLVASAGSDRRSPTSRRCCSAATGCPRNRSPRQASSPGSCANPSSSPSSPRPGSASKGGTPPQSEVTTSRRSRRRCPWATPRCGPRWPTR